MKIVINYRFVKIMNNFQKYKYFLTTILQSK